ncbi:sigma 54-interacting transcriptional regulator [Methylotetracoccus oryzae]|uniref:sigma 54-interacting transcriptional regulator n=1 Tax=Methylotetracoccus oryzae TaxID=1919059 RepID=UPI0013A57725|nr:sigma 54-interacting transcriptional regulator [Methylotetracoccus oryzae]
MSRSDPLDLCGICHVLPEAITIFDTSDPAYPVAFVNHAFEELTGFSGAEVDGNSILRFFDESDAPRVLGSVGDALRNGRPQHLAAIGLRRDGTRFDSELSLARLPLPDGETMYVVALQRDVSRREEELRALAVQRDRLLEHLETAPLGILALDSVLNGIAIIDARRSNMPLVYVNAAFERLTGYTAEEVLGQSWGFLHAANHDAVTAAAIEAAIAERKETRMEALQFRKDGSHFWVELSLSPVFDDDGQPTHYLAIQADISERKEAVSRLEQLSLELRRNRDDLTSILNQFACATLIVDGNGMVTFASASCEAVLALSPSQVTGQIWPNLLPLPASTVAELWQNLNAPPAGRKSVQLGWSDEAGAEHWTECSIKDDPRDPSRRIAVVYDVTELYRLRQRLEARTRGALIGDSEPMQRLHRLIADIARGTWTVLIEGETGSGKELVARAVHDGGPRKQGPFVAVNSAGLSESLLASQLFGHRKGAFTGATCDQQGYFEAASGGTLFLDEIGDLPLSMQASLLRVLQEREVTRLGETRPRPVDVRVIAASHKDLAAEVRAGRFREDLLFRLRVARITVPPLRNRRTDIPLLVEHFLRDACSQAGKSLSGLAPETLQSLLSYEWPGNVRELKSCVDYAVICAAGPRVHPDELPPELRQACLSAPAEPFPAYPGDEADERSRILAALNATRGNRSQAAKRLGISRATFYRRLRDLELNVDD